MKLKDKVALITGASRGIGSALCVALAKEGCHIVAASKTLDPDPRLPGTLRDTVREVEMLNRRAYPYQVDVRDDEQVAVMIEAVKKRFGQIDILINNAGAIFMADVADTPIKRYDLVMGVNARASFICSQAVLPVMKAQGGGHIIMMSPPIKIDHAPGKAAYALSKLGMTFIAQSLAEEVKEYNIAVNALWPVTMIDSQATRHFWPGSEAAWRTPDIVCDATIDLLTRDPMKRTGRAYLDEEVLKEIGVTDFSKYNVVPGADTPPLSIALFDPGFSLSV